MSEPIQRCLAPVERVEGALREDAGALIPELLERAYVDGDIDKNPDSSEDDMELRNLRLTCNQLAILLQPECVLQ